MLDHISPEKILFLDIETVPAAPVFEDLPERIQALWLKKALYISRENETPEEAYGRAGIYAEFGKIVCVSAGLYRRKGTEGTLRLKSFFGDDEKEILTGFSGLLQDLSGKGAWSLCAHNGKEFDFPYLARRMLINGLRLPSLLDMAGKKPWEVPFLDTMELWKFGDYKHYTSLDLLAAIFGIPTPKDDIDGSRVAHTYYEEKNLEKITRYCEKDVLTVVQIFLRFQGKPLVRDENISSATLF
ncbi:MAG: 3'-5' exonuclease [Chlorobi bacterium]|nr:3'-5' exonuclease [Chlorobiota bacterium]